ncbi:MAG TPA: 3-isopropylmalate dehydratase small subunit [Porticoccaceae bacterium]|nr:3-isopropylmalate dehydratase small subunit [Porticoccaceae bacterium]
MRAFTRHCGVVGPMDRANVDTDMIIPKQFLKSIKRSGFGPNLFDDLRYLDTGEPGEDCKNRPINLDFPLNQERYQNASVLLTRANFGCGSSREHAPWALHDYGFRAIIATSFADIFYNNCFKNGLLPIVLDENEVAYLFDEVLKNEGYRLTIDLEAQRVVADGGSQFHFVIDDFRKQCLLQGLDEIDLTLQEMSSIQAYEKQHAEKYPWIFGAIK